MKTMRILLADDHALMRAGIRLLLEAIPGVEVVAEAGDGRQALELMGASRPDLALMDIAMPGLNGLEAAARAAQEHPEVRIIILSMHSSQEYVRRALQAGAKGYVLKDADIEELRRAVETVADGGIYLGRAVKQHLVAAFARGGTDEPIPFDRLTPRQREVLRLLAKGRRTKEIARELLIGVRTVDATAQVMALLGIHEVAGLVRYAIRMGLIGSEE